MIAQSLYQANDADLAEMTRQRRACRRAARKLQWPLAKELTSETPVTLPLLMRPGVKTLLVDAERRAFDTLLIAAPDALLCEPQELEALLTVLGAHDIHVFACQTGRWVEPGGRHYAPLPAMPWAAEEEEPGISIDLN